MPLWIRDSSVTSIDDIKARLNATPCVVVYPLASPVTETAAPFAGTQLADAYGTEEFADAGVAAGTRDVAIPVGHETVYAFRRQDQA